jgi:hypothetical protein
MNTLESGFAFFPFWIRFLALLVLLWVIMGIGYTLYEAKRASGESVSASIGGLILNALFGAISAVIAIFGSKTTP